MPVSFNLSKASAKGLPFPKSHCSQYFDHCADPVSGIPFYKDLATAADARTGRSRIVYIRGTNINEAINRAVEDTLPLSCGAEFYRSILQVWVSGYNLRTGIAGLQWENAGITDLPLLLEVVLFLSDLFSDF